jgi:hypothetical protein
MKFHGMYHDPKTQGFSILSTGICNWSGHLFSAAWFADAEPEQAMTGDREAGGLER